ITINDGSWDSIVFNILCVKKRPIKNIIKIKIGKMLVLRLLKKLNQQIVATMLAHVPGAIGSLPI
ncbi:MAG: hypothetical protein VX177_02820, partial [Candidatus Neomarinimicrobiota bacterium]|nr:hypothetical protein [Candidatus Neomarinimicrobiota bacterium]